MVFPTRTFKQMVGEDGGTTGIDDEFAARELQNIGAWILGRNMFRTRPGRMAGRHMEELVGRQPALPTSRYSVLTHHASDRRSR